MSGKFMMNGIEYLGGGSGGGGGNVDDVYVNGESVLDENKIAQVTSYKEITLAEYQALPSSKLTDGIMYCIKDIGGANQFPPLIYSDEEREIGVWRDGKPLYQKVIECGAMPSNTTEKFVNHGIANIDEICFAKGFCYDPTGGWGFEVNLTNNNTSSQTAMWISKTQISLTSFGADRSAYNATVAIYYTKTTDTAGSGTWTTDGTYAHHYSTSEKVIGTWVDGKPVYEKSWNFDSYIIAQPNAITSLESKGVTLSDVKFIVNSVVYGKVDKRVHNFLSVGYFGGSIGIFNVTSNDYSAIDGITLQYTKTTD